VSNLNGLRSQNVMSESTTSGVQHEANTLLLLSGSAVSRVMKCSAKWNDPISRMGLICTG
jgi:hypothetical protein